MSSLHLKFIPPLILLIFLNACSTLQVDKAQVKKIRKLAIAGFIVHQEMPQGLSWNLSSHSKKPPSQIEFGSSLMEPSSHAERMYRLFCKSLNKSMHWEILDRKKLRQNGFYSNFYNRSTTGFQNRPPVGKNIRSFGAKGIVDSYSIQKMDAAARSTLIKKLGVNAIAAATIRVKLEKAGGLKKLIGAGELKPQAILSFRVYGENGESIWQDTWVRGKTVEGTEHMLGITNIDALNKQVVKAAFSSYKVLVHRYRNN